MEAQEPIHTQRKPRVYVWEYIKRHLPNHLLCYKLRQHQQCDNARVHSAVFPSELKWVLLPNSPHRHEESSCTPSGRADGRRGFPEPTLRENDGVDVLSAAGRRLCEGRCPGASAPWRSGNAGPTAARPCELGQVHATAGNDQVPHL